MDAFCRVCMLRKSRMTPLADSRNGTPISDLLVSVCGTHFKESHQFPQVICERCLVRLELAHVMVQEFRGQELLLQSLWQEGVLLMSLEQCQTAVREECRSEGLLRGLIASLAQEKETEIRDTVMTIDLNEVKEEPCSEWLNQKAEQKAVVSESLVKEELIIKDCSVLPLGDHEFSISNEKQAMATDTDTAVPVTEAIMKEELIMEDSLDALDEPDEPPEQQEDNEEPGAPVADTVVKEKLIIEDTLDIPNEAKKVKVKRISREAKKIYSCKECGKKFSLLNRYQCHLKKHENIQRGSFQCSVCEERLGKAKDLRAHMRAKHPGTWKEESKRTCVLCDRHFTDLKNFHLHTSWHKRIGLTCCSTCGEDLISSESIHQHVCSLATPAPGPPASDRFQCEECGKWFAKMSIYEIHREQHENIRKGLFKCDVCSQCLGGEAELLNHKKEHQGPTQKCNECAREFTSEKAYRKHATCHKKERNETFVCNLCDKSFLRHGRLFNHKCKAKELPKDGEGSSCSKSATEQPARDQVNFQCEECGKRYLVERLYTNHMQRHVNIRNGKFKCDICQQCFGGERELRNHKRDYHKLMPEWMQNCGECGHKFTNLNSYRCHMRRHSVIRDQRFRCSTCESYFGERKTLLMHKCTGKLASE